MHVGRQLNIYGGIYGLRGELSKLGKEIEGKKAELDALTRAVENLKFEHRAVKEAVEAIQELKRRNIGVNEILGINKASSKFGTPLDVLKALEYYGNIRRLEEKQTELEGAIKELEQRHAELSGRLDRVLKGFTEEMIRRIKELDAEAAKRLSEIDTKRTKVFDEIKTISKGFKESLNELTEKALDVGNKLGQYDALNPIYKLLSECEGERHEVLPAVLKVNVSFRIWLEKHPPKTLWLDDHLKDLLKSIRDEMER